MATRLTGGNIILKILVIIPAYNEETNLRSTIYEVKTVANTLNSNILDILVVDDGSTDKTLKIAHSLGVSVLHLPFNLRIGGAVQTGLKYALLYDYDIAIQVDADGQHNPQYIPKLIKPILDGTADIVIGSRFLSDGSAENPVIRKMGIKYFSWITSVVLKKTITDCTSGFRALNKKAISFFAKDYPVDFPDAEALIMANFHNLKIVEIPTPFRARKSGKSSLNKIRTIYYPFKETLSILRLILSGGK